MTTLCATICLHVTKPLLRMNTYCYACEWTLSSRTIRQLRLEWLTPTNEYGDILKEQELWLFEDFSFSYVLTKEVGLALAPNGVVTVRDEYLLFVKMQCVSLMMPIRVMRAFADDSFVAIVPGDALTSCRRRCAQHKPSLQSLRHNNLHVAEPLLPM